MPVESPTDIGTFIVRSPGKGNGRPTLSPSGVSVRRIVELTREGMSAEEIIDDMRHVTMAEVFAALSYYWANQQEVDADIREEREFFDGMSNQQEGGASRIA